MILLEYLKSVRRLFLNHLNRKYYSYTDSDFENELRKVFKKRTREDLDFKKPVTFNQKMQWLKLYDSTPLKAKLADKYAVRDWVKQTIGDQYLIPILWGGVKNVESIDFDALPVDFVLKTNHASGTNIIVSDKSRLNIKDTKLKLKRWLSNNYAFKHGFEMHYGMIEPCIICERYMGDNLNDYKIFCFDGDPAFFWVDASRFTDHCRNTYDLDWNEMPFVIDRFKRVRIERPKNLQLMIDLARKLSKGFSFVRVDFYEIDGKVYFGEMSFTSSSGMDKFYPHEYDKIIGDKLLLPAKKNIPLDLIKRIWKKRTH